MKKIVLIPGDGIGPEVSAAAVEVLRSAGDFEFIPASAGFECWKKTGKPVPDETVAAIREAGVCLKGPITTPEGVEGYRSANVELRRIFDLYANVRPCKSFSGVNALRGDVDLVVVRENTEGLYAGIEGRIKQDAFAMRVITKMGSERICRFAFELAAKRRKHVTCVHKANILRQSCGVFKAAFYDVAKRYKGIAADDDHVDAVAMRLIKEPQRFDVLVTTNLFGDILSDEAAQVVGGLGVTPGANIGERCAIFEPVHGSAPKHAGKNEVNPTAAILAAAMMLDYMKKTKEAGRIRKAVESVLASGDRRMLTYDLGGSAKTSEMAREIAKRV